MAPTSGIALWLPRGLVGTARLSCLQWPGRPRPRGGRRGTWAAAVPPLRRDSPWAPAVSATSHGMQCWDEGEQAWRLRAEGQPGGAQLGSRTARREGAGQETAGFRGPDLRPKRPTAASHMFVGDLHGRGEAREPQTRRRRGRAAKAGVRSSAHYSLPWPSRVSRSFCDLEIRAGGREERGGGRRTLPPASSSDHSRPSSRLASAVAPVIPSAPRYSSVPGRNALKPSVRGPSGPTSRLSTSNAGASRRPGRLCRGPLGVQSSWGCRAAGGSEQRRCESRPSLGRPHTSPSSPGPCRPRPASCCPRRVSPWRRASRSPP